jgi:hypothetical protein
VQHENLRQQCEGEALPRAARLSGRNAGDVVATAGRGKPLLKKKGARDLIGPRLPSIRGKGGGEMPPDRPGPNYTGLQTGFLLSGHATLAYRGGDARATLCRRIPSVTD